MMWYNGWLILLFCHVCNVANVTLYILVGVGTLHGEIVTDVDWCSDQGSGDGGGGGREFRSPHLPSRHPQSSFLSFSLSFILFSFFLSLIVVFHPSFMYSWFLYNFLLSFVFSFVLSFIFLLSFSFFLLFFLSSFFFVSLFVCLFVSFLPSFFQYWAHNSPLKGIMIYGWLTKLKEKRISTIQKILLLILLDARNQKHHNLMSRLTNKSTTTITHEVAW